MQVFVVAQIAKHRARFHVVPIQNQRVWASVQLAGFIQKDCAVGIVIALVIAVQIVAVVALYHGLIQHVRDVQPTDDI